MLSNIIGPGCKIDLQIMEKRKTDENDQADKPIYHSQVYDILTEDKLEIVMPMEKTKLILLSVDEEYDVTFYSGKTLYQCFVRVVDRYKSNNMYIVAVELISSLRKCQRREYFRFNCAIEMRARNLEEPEVRQIIEKNHCDLIQDMPFRSGIMVDISGGGMRFMSQEDYERGKLICCSFGLNIGGQMKVFNAISMVLYIKDVVNRKDVYEYRVKFIGLKLNEREEIIKYIFEEERKNRRKELGE